MCYHNRKKRIIINNVVNEELFECQKTFEDLTIKMKNISLEKTLFESINDVLNIDSFIMMYLKRDIVFLCLDEIVKDKSECEKIKNDFLWCIASLKKSEELLETGISEEEAKERIISYNKYKKLFCDLKTKFEKKLESVDFDFEILYEKIEEQKKKNQQLCELSNKVSSCQELIESEILLIREIILSDVKAKKEKKLVLDKLLFLNENIKSDDDSEEINFSKYNEKDYSVNNIPYLTDEEISEISGYFSTLKALSNGMIDIKKFIEEINELYSSVSLFFSGFQIEYIITYGLQMIEEKIIEEFNILLDDKEIFTSQSYKEVLLEEIKLLDQKYDFLCLKRKELLEESAKKEKEELGYAKSFEEQGTNRLVYLQMSNGSSCIVGDLKNIPENYYSSIIILLNKLKHNNLLAKESKKLKDCDGLLELKDWKVRVFYRHVGANIYCVIGTGIKKDQRDYKLVRSQAQREINYREENTQKHENEIEEICFSQNELKPRN